MLKPEFYFRHYTEGYGNEKKHENKHGNEGHVFAVGFSFFANFCEAFFVVPRSSLGDDEHGLSKRGIRQTGSSDASLAESLLFGEWMSWTLDCSSKTLSKTHGSLSLVTFPSLIGALSLA